MIRLLEVWIECAEIEDAQEIATDINETLGNWGVNNSVKVTDEVGE